MAASFGRGMNGVVTGIARVLSLLALAGAAGCTGSEAPLVSSPDPVSAHDPDAASPDAGTAVPDAGSGTDGDIPFETVDAASTPDDAGPLVVAPVCSAPQGSTASAASLATGDTAFALAFYPPAEAAADAGTNVVLSPYSVSTTMTMVDVGAVGETASQIEAALHLPGGASTEAPAYAALACQIESDGASNGDSMLVANSLWGQQGFAFEPTFESVLSTGYDAPLQQIDFMADPNAAVTSIDAWVSGKTQGLVPSLLQPGDLTVDTRFVLVNALYFKGVWASGFDPGQTATQPFTLADSTVVSATTMHATVDGARNVATQDLTVLELPYRGDKLALDILMPTIASGGVAALEAALTPSVLSADLALPDTTSIDLYLPKFSFSTRLSLIPILSGLGITDAFEPGGADFSGIDGAKDLNLQVVVQQAFVEVDEQGTVAAAATAGGGGIANVVVEPTTLRIDHPFLFLIRDLRNSVILFMGQVFDPQGN